MQKYNYEVCWTHTTDSRYNAKMARSSILIVDTDSELSKIVGAFLNSQGFRVNHVTRVRDAITKLSMQKYSAIVLEPHLSSGEHGEEVIFGAIDPSGANHKTPVVLTTNALNYELPNEILSQVQAIVTKPFQFDDLLGAIKGCIK